MQKIKVLHQGKGSLNLYERRAEFSNSIKSSRSRDANKSPEDVLFDMFKNKETQQLSVGKFLAALRATGIGKKDPRLSEFMEGLRAIQKKLQYEGSSPESLKLDRENFRK
ncbi:hypothetical protein RUM44_007359 [Polyplax serrata]|uniref:Glutaminase EF-hand domain-containing protein n=1 Tax=Polyplax serrata TaxID=468196 RepID=A0ABR1B0G9_POLSC